MPPTLYFLAPISSSWLTATCLAQAVPVPLAPQGPLWRERPFCGSVPSVVLPLLPYGRCTWWFQFHLGLLSLELGDPTYSATATKL